MDRKKKKNLIIRVLSKEEIKYNLEYVDNMQVLYKLCKEYLEGMEEAEFLELMVEIIQEGAPEIGEDFQDVAAGLKIGNLYVEM